MPRCPVTPLLRCDPRLGATTVSSMDGIQEGWSHLEMGQKYTVGVRCAGVCRLRGSSGRQNSAQKGDTAEKHKHTPHTHTIHTQVYLTTKAPTWFGSALQKHIHIMMTGCAYNM
jgi:hypothetical protein